MDAGKKQSSDGVGRRGVDLAAQYAIGVNNAIKGLTDILGVGNPASQFLETNSEWYQDLLSATACQNNAEVGRILAEAEDKGTIDQLFAGAKAFGAAPADILAGGLGSLSTFAAGGVAARGAGFGMKGVLALQSAMGSGMQVGIVKSEIYEGVKSEMKGIGKTQEEAEQIAREAQSYSGKNLDQILVGAGLGAVDGATGAQRIIGRALMRGGLGHGASRVAAVIGGGFSEGAVEGLQAGQEKLAGNIGSIRDGASPNVFRGVVGAGTLESLAGGVIGAGMAGVQKRVESDRARGTSDASGGGEVFQEVAGAAPMPNKTTREDTPESPRETPIETLPQVAGVVADKVVPKALVSLEKARVLGVENDSVGAYVAATYPELSKTAKNPDEFADNVRLWRSKLETEISEGKFLNKKIGTGDFVHQYGYEPSPTQYAEMLEGHRRQQLEIQQGWVTYLREGGYSDQVSSLMLNSITKETAYRRDGQWEFRKLGGSSNRLPPAPDPELAAQFSQNFTGDRRPSQAIAEAYIDITRKAALVDSSGKNLKARSGDIAWIRLPSKSEAPSEFEANVKRLTDISRTVEEFGCCKWCTGHGKARDYLEQGDFWVGVDGDGIARLGIRLEKGEIQEIRGVLHSQAVEPGLAPELTKIVSEQSLSGGEKWIKDAEIKGRVAELAKGGSWDDLKRIVGKEDDNEAADYIHSYRGPSGSYDLLVGADNNTVQKITWERLGGKPLTPLNMAARAGSFSQSRDWVDGSVLDTARETEHGGGRALHGLFADNEGGAGKAPNFLREWGLLTKERQNSTDGEGDNIWHIQAGGRGRNLSKSVGGADKSDLLQFLQWDGIERGSLFAPNNDGLTPLHIFFEKQTETARHRGGQEYDERRKEAVAAGLGHARGSDLLGNGGGTYKYPIIFSVARGRMLAEVVEAGGVSPPEISEVRDETGDTPWHKTEVGDLRRLAEGGHMTAALLKIEGAEQISVADYICSKPGGFELLTQNGLLDASNAGSAKGARVASLGHSVADAGEAEKALASGLFSGPDLLEPNLGTGDNFLHLWGNRSLRCSSDKDLRRLVSGAGLIAEDFDRTNNKLETAHHFFAERPGALKLLAQAGLVTKEGLGARAGVWKDTPLHKLPMNSSDTYHSLAEAGVLTREHMLQENSSGRIPLHQYIRDEFNGGDGVLGVRKMADILGLKSEDFTGLHGSAGHDALDVVRDLRRKQDSTGEDPLLDFTRAGLIDYDTVFQQRHSQVSELVLSDQTDNQKEMSRRMAGRSPFEDAVRRGGSSVFQALCDDGAITPARMKIPHDPRSEWSNFSEFTLKTAEEEPGWDSAVTSAINSKFLDRECVAVEGRNKGGPIFLRLGDMASGKSILAGARAGLLLPSDFTVDGPEGKASLLASACTQGGGTLELLAKGGHLEPGALSKTSIPYGADNGNPARYFLEKDPSLFIFAARAGLIDKEDSVFGRWGFGGPMEYATRNGKLKDLASAGVLGPWMTSADQGMRSVWVDAGEAGVTGELVRGLISGGATSGQVRESFLRVGQDGRNALSSLRDEGAADALAELAAAGVIKKRDMDTEQGSSAIRIILERRPRELHKLVESGLLEKGDLYTGHLGAKHAVKIAVGMARNDEEEIKIVRGIVDSGVLGSEDKPRLARDLCRRPAGSAALRSVVSEGVIQSRDLTDVGDDGKAALDLLLGRASVTAARRGDLAYLLDKGLVPAEYLGRFSRGAEGTFSPVSDTFDRVTGRLSKLLSISPGQELQPLRAPTGGRGIATAEQSRALGVR